MSSFFWPNTRHQETTAWIRFGRLLHWSAYLVGMFISTIGWMVMFLGSENMNERLAILAGCIAASFLIALFGRALRYVISNE